MDRATALCRMTAPALSCFSSWSSSLANAALQQGFVPASKQEGALSQGASRNSSNSFPRPQLLLGSQFNTTSKQNQCMRNATGVPFSVRHLITQAQSSPVPAVQDVSLKVATAQEVFQQIQMKKLREELETVAEARLHIPYSEFVDVAKGCGAKTDDEAAEYCQTLHKAGLILRQQDTVYLRADEVAEMVMLMLPGGKEDAMAKLQKVETELAEMDKVHTLVEKRSSRTANFILAGGFVILFTQFVAFIYLTWWELSWDVMEPIAYIISLFYSLVAYSYFMATRHVFDLEPIREFVSTRLRHKHITKLQFDADRYDFLKELAERYRRHLSHARIR